jgi:hypothetical protein
MSTLSGVVSSTQSAHPLIIEQLAVSSPPLYTGVRKEFDSDAPSAVSAARDLPGLCKVTAGPAKTRKATIKSRSNLDFKLCRGFKLCRFSIDIFLSWMC